MPGHNEKSREKSNAQRITRTGSRTITVKNIPVGSAFSLLLASIDKFFLRKYNFDDYYYTQGLSTSDVFFGFIETDPLNDAIEQKQIEFLPFFDRIVNEDDTILRDYGAIAEEIELLRDPFEPGKFGIKYSEAEEQKLSSRYSFVEPQLQITLESSVANNSVYQNSIQPIELTFDSLSSLGPVAQETITVTATTGSVTGLITEQAETITDVGGLSGGGRDREIQSTGVDVGSTSTRTVTTSGY